MAVLAMAVMACGSGGDADPFRIGVMESMTGPGETYGTVASQAKQMAADEINAAGGIDGRMLELIVEDSQCSAKDAIAAYNKLTDVDGVKIILGTSLQQRHAGRRSPGGGGRRDPLLRTGQQSGHRQRRRLHLPDSDQRHTGGHRHRERPVGGRGPQAGHHHRDHRLRGGREAHLRRPVPETRREGRGRRAVSVRRHRLQVPAGEAIRRGPGCAPPGAPVRVRGGAPSSSRRGRSATRAPSTRRRCRWAPLPSKSRGTRRPA